MAERDEYERCAVAGHDCRWCGGRIDPGERHLAVPVVSGDGDGVEFLRFHLECHGAWAEFGGAGFPAFEQQRPDGGCWQI